MKSIQRTAIDVYDSQGSEGLLGLAHAACKLLTDTMNNEAIPRRRAVLSVDVREADLMSVTSMAHLIEELGMSCQEFADVVGITRSQMSNIVKGKVKSPHPQTVRRIADALRIRNFAAVEQWIVNSGREEKSC